MARMKKIEIEAAATFFGTKYPPPFDAPCKERKRWRLGLAAGLAQFGVNMLRLPKGQWSSQRHWHHRNDEFVVVLEGEVVLVTDAGEEILRAGDFAGFKAGEADGHHIQNRSESEAVLLEIGSRFEDDIAEYPDIDMRGLPEGYVHKDGTPYGAPRALVTPPAADVPKLARIVLHVSNIEQANAFYSELLGQKGRFVGGGRLYFDCGPVLLALLDPTSGGREARPAPDTITFTVANVESIHARAKALGCLDNTEVHGAPAGEIVTRPWGERSFYVVDPWGNGLCFSAEGTLFRGDRAARG